MSKVESSKKDEFKISFSLKDIGKIDKKIKGLENNLNNELDKSEIAYSKEEYDWLNHKMRIQLKNWFYLTHVKIVGINSSQLKVWPMKHYVIYV